MGPPGQYFDSNKEKIFYGLFVDLPQQIFDWGPARILASWGMRPETFWRSEDCKINKCRFWECLRAKSFSKTEAPRRKVCTLMSHNVSFLSIYNWKHTSEEVCCAWKKIYPSILFDIKSIHKFRQQQMAGITYCTHFCGCSKAWGSSCGLQGFGGFRGLQSTKGYSNKNHLQMLDKSNNLQHKLQI